MKLNKFFLFSILTFFIVSLPKANAATAEYNGKNYSIHMVYNRDVRAGDPIFIQALFIFNNGFITKKDIRNTKTAVSGTLRLINKETEKCLKQSELFCMDEKCGKNSCTVVSAVPTSTYLEKDFYAITVEYSIADKEKNSFTLPINYNSRTFVSEEIPLNAKNTAIKSDISNERSEQIKKLNKILENKNFDAYKTKKLEEFSEPLVCSRRTSFFGDRRTFIYVNKKKVTNLHYGIDYGVPVGTNVYSCSNGKVVMAENRISTGWSICIEHLPGLYSLYYHLDKLNVKYGDIVKKGQLIGNSGCTGLATGPHLHWEMRLNSEAVDPDWFVQTYPIIFLQEKEKFFRQ